MDVHLIFDNIFLFVRDDDPEGHHMTFYLHASQLAVYDQSPGSFTPFGQLVVANCVSVAHPHSATTY
jgi:hypothetical protein